MPERRRRRRRGSSDGGNIFEQVAGGVATFAGNLFGDVRDAVMGLPMGVVNLAKDPIETTEAVGESVWQTWSPLFSGDLGKFGRQLYDHPLAPILDVISVFTLGAGTAARGASALSKAGATSSRIEKVASLRVPKAVEIADPTGKRLPQTFSLSTRAGRRLVQEARLALEPHLPKVFSSTLRRARFERLHGQDMAHRVVAKTMMLNSALEAGRLLADDAPEAPRMRAEIAAHQHINLLRHNRALDEAEAKSLVKGGHVNYITAPAAVNRRYVRQLHRLRRKEARLDKVRSDNAELANSLKRIEDELAQANEELTKLRQEGYATTETQAMELDDATRRVADLETRLEKARKAKGLYDDATSQLADIKAQRMALEKRSFKEFYEQFGHSAQAFENGMENFGHWATTSDIRRAARTKDGRVYVVPKHDAYNLGLEAKRSHAFVRAVWHNPTMLWKRLMIGWTPRSITNNFVGNWTIYALREGPAPEAAQALYDAIRYSKGEREAFETFRAALPFKRDHWLYRYFADELGDVFGRQLLDEADVKSRAGRIARSGFYPIVHKLADQPVRVASIFAFLRKHPEIRRLMDEQGIDFNKAVQQALRKNPVIRDQTVQHVRSTAGDYATWHAWERPINNLVPFYLWYRHIVRTGWNMTLETPGRLSLATRLSALGIESTKELLGEIPEFLEGAIPLSALGLDDEESGRKDVLLTASLNPFASIGEIASLVEAFSVGTDPRGLGPAMMGVNPFLSAGVEAVSGRSLLTGAPKDTVGGLIPSVLTATAEGLPQVRLIEALTSADTRKTDAGNELLFARDDRSPISSLFGIPIRDVSLETAERLSRFESGEESGRRRRRRRRR